MLILLHKINGTEFVINTEVIAIVKEQSSSFGFGSSGAYELHTTTGTGSVEIAESPQQVCDLQEQAFKKARGGK